MSKGSHLTYLHYVYSLNSNRVVIGNKVSLIEVQFNSTFYFIICAYYVQ